jgi:hypothetical protein
LERISRLELSSGDAGLPNYGAKHADPKLWMLRHRYRYGGVRQLLLHHKVAPATAYFDKAMPGKDRANFFSRKDT